MKSLVNLLGQLLQDCGSRCNAPVSRDLVTVKRRAELEGDGFITITLPAFCKGFEQALESGSLDPTLFPHYLWVKQGRRPAFLQGFVSQVFGTDGRLLQKPSTDCIRAVRQICLFAKKINLECSDARLVSAMRSFVECEQQILSEDAYAPAGTSLFEDKFQQARHLLWGTYRQVCRIVMSDIIDNDWYEALRPRHGRGATSESIMGNQKWAQKSWTERLEGVLPFSEFGVGSVRNLPVNMGSLNQGFTLTGSPEPVGAAINLLSPEDERPVRVVFVPKTQSAPRVIAVEPVCMQYTQQALMTYLVPRIESGKYTKGRVNFRSQQYNQVLAREGSVYSKTEHHGDLSYLVRGTGQDEGISYWVPNPERNMNHYQPFRADRERGASATIDLSEASDRVSQAMASELYAICPFFRDVVFATRSTRAALPFCPGSPYSGRILSLRKFASMGSAMCFPTEAMVFFCAIVSSRILTAHHALRENLEKSRRWSGPVRMPSVTQSSVRKFARRIAVYGDDLIVPAAEAFGITADLELLGLKVNRRKSFWNGRFRESCGKDWYAGEDVTPTYLRRPVPCDARDASGIVSAVATANQLFEAGYWRTATAIKEAVEDLVGVLPEVSKDSPAIGWHQYSEVSPRTRWNRELMRLEALLLVPTPRRAADPLNGDAALAKCFSLIGSPNVEPRHLLESVSPYSLALKRRWVSYAL